VCFDDDGRFLRLRVVEPESAGNEGEFQAVCTVRNNGDVDLLRAMILNQDWVPMCEAMQREK